MVNLRAEIAPYVTATLGDPRGHRSPQVQVRSLTFEVLWMKSIVVKPLLMLLLLALGHAALAEEPRPVELVQREVSAILKVLDDQSLDASTKKQVLSDRIARNFDFDDMSRSILAVNWKDATEDQKVRFKALFRKVLADKYVSAIQKRTTETVKVGGERIRGDRASVIVTIERDASSDIPLLFKLKRLEDRWVAYDANVEGLSLVQHYRSEFANIAKSQGIDGVIAHLEAKTAT